MSPCAVNVHSSSTLLGPACCSLFWRKIYNQECPLPVILRVILETLGVSRLVKECPDFTKLEGLSPCSEKPSSALCWPSWIQFTSCFFYRYFNRLLFSHLHRLPSSLLPLDFQANKLCISHAPLCATCAPNLALLDVNNLTTGESTNYGNYHAVFPFCSYFFCFRWNILGHLQSMSFRTNKIRVL